MLKKLGTLQYFTFDVIFKKLPWQVVLYLQVTEFYTVSAFRSGMGIENGLRGYNPQNT